VRGLLSSLLACLDLASMQAKHALADSLILYMYELLGRA
jgi:hypothetical protein